MNKYSDMVEAKDAMREVMRATQSGVSDAELAMHIADQFGGMEGLANEFKLTYQDSPEGSKNRITLLGLAIKLIENVSSRQAAAVASQTIEECQAELEAEIRKLQSEGRV